MSRVSPAPRESGIAIPCSVSSPASKVRWDASVDAKSPAGNLSAKPPPVKPITVAALSAHGKNKSKTQRSPEAIKAMHEAGDCESMLSWDDEPQLHTHRSDASQASTATAGRGSSTQSGVIAVGDKAKSLNRVRTEIKERIVEAVLDEVMPDSAEYDMESMAQMAKPRSEDGAFVRWLKFFGILDLSLHEAVLSGSLEHLVRAVKKIMKHKKYTDAEMAMYINEYDTSGQTALSLACKVNRTDMAEVLLRDGNAEADVIDSRSGMSPLMYAVLHRNSELVFLLVTLGASVNMCDFRCVSPVMLAASGGNMAVLRTLCALEVSAFADINSQDERGWTALHYAAHAGHVECVVYLLEECSANRDVKDVKGFKPMHIAVFQDNGLVVSALQDLRSKIAMATGEEF